MSKTAFSFARILSLALVVVLLGPLTPAQADDVSVERFKAKLLGIETSYGQEKWKTSPAFQTFGDPSQLQTSLENDAGQHDGALGYRVILRIQLTDEAGNNVPADPIENRNVNLTASLRTGKGGLPAYVQRMGCTAPGVCDSLVFKLHFDVDGSNPITPGVMAQEGLQGGTGQVDIKIFKRGTGTNTIDAGSDNMVFAYQRPAHTVRIDSFGERDHVAEVPETTFRLLHDIGEGTTIPFITEQVPAASNLVAEYAFGIPDRTVRWMALTATPCSSERCAPTDGAARSEVFSRVLATSKTNEAGNVSFTLPVRDLLNFPGRTTAFTSAIVVVAAALQPEADLPADLGSQYAKGGFDVVAGSHEFVVPIGARPARVTGYSINTQLHEGIGNRSDVPTIIKDRVMQTNSLTVKLYDDAGQPCGNCGDAVAIIPDGDGKLAAKGTISSDPQAGEYANKYKVASIRVGDIQATKASWYRVLALFYGSAASERDVFQGMAYADRGFEIETATVPARITEQGTYYVNITSRSTNYDTTVNEPQFDMKLLFRLMVERGANRTEAITLREGAVSNLQFKVSSSMVGPLSLTYEATSGDTLVGPKVDTMTFHDKAPKKKFADRIPGFEVALLCLALIGVAILARRREAF